MLAAMSLSESKWLVPFAAIALAALSLLRPPPHFPPPEQYRVVKDAAGVDVPIEIPFRGAVLTWCAYGASNYLGHTHSPQTLVSAGGKREREWLAKRVWSRIYPRTLQDDSLWRNKFSDRFAAIEGLLAFDAGAYLGGCGAVGVVSSLRTVGLPVLSLSPFPKGKDWNEALYAMARVETAMIGEPERGEALIAAYKQAYADLDAELQTQTLAEHPRILIMGSYNEDRGHLYVKNAKNDYRIYLPPAGVVNAAGSVPQDPDAERILIIDPDMIFLMGGAQTPQEFKRDPRWRGLKAVIDNRVYRMPGDPFGGGGLEGLHFQPLWVRWMAEIAHSDRLQPKLREMLREHFVSEFDYRLSDEQIDQFLHIDENIGAADYARFTKNYQANNAAESPR